MDTSPLITSLSSALRYADELAGESWSGVQPRVDRLITSYDRATTYGQQVLIEQRIRRLLQREVPEILDLVDSSAFLHDYYDAETKAGWHLEAPSTVNLLFRLNEESDADLVDSPDFVRMALSSLEPKLQPWLLRYRESSDPATRSRTERNVRLILRNENPVLLRAFDSAAYFLEQSFEFYGDPDRTRGIGFPKDLFGAEGAPAGEGAVGPEMAAASQVLQRYTDISCPRKVWIESRRVPVVVRLTREPDPDSEVVAPVHVEPGSVVVRLHAPGFARLTQRTQTIMVEPDADSTPAVFYLRPEVIGTHPLSFDFWQAGNLLGSAELGIEITADEVSESSTQVGARLAIGNQAPAADIQLRIRYSEEGGRAELGCELSFFGELGSYECRPKTIPNSQSLQAYIDGLYRQLDLLREQYDPQGGTIEKGRRLLSPALVTQRLRDLGQNLWRDLIPQDFKNIYDERRNQFLRTDKPLSLCIISDETIIPWELVWPRKSRAWVDDGPWCESFHLARWLPRGAGGDEPVFIDGPLQVLPLQSMAILTPEFSERPLHAAQAERSDLLERIQRLQVSNRSPERSDEEHVRALMEAGGFSWFHLVTHGVYVHKDNQRVPLLWLEGTTSLAPEMIIGTIEDRIREERPAFVFHACDVGRGTWGGIAGYDGWAARLIGAGAGMFLAPLWEVTDQLAPAFSAAFYDALLNGETVAAAVRAGRLAARKDGDPSWLAYSLYAHPNARVQLPTAGRNP